MRFWRAYGIVAVALAAGPAGCSDTARPVRSAAQIAPNATMSGHVSVCVRPLRPRIRAFTLDGHTLPFTVSAGHEPRCRGDALRILRIQRLIVGGQVAFVRRGGCDVPTRGSRCSRQPTAHVLERDLAPVALDAAQRNGNGAAVGPCSQPASDDPAAAGRQLARMYYKRPSDLPGHSVAGARWSNYGDPVRSFGRAHANYLLWNLPRTAFGVLAGGGIVEAVLAQGEPMLLCDVPGIALPSFDARGRRNGRVRFAYAQVASAGQSIYGWVLRGYDYARRPFTSTVALPATPP